MTVVGTMFSRLFKSVIDGFDGSLPTTLSQLGAQVLNTSPQSPNNFLEDSSDISGFSAVYMGHNAPYTGRKAKVNNVVERSITGPYINNANLTKQLQSCEAAGSGSQFNRLSYLAANVDNSAAARCGWVYNTVNPDNGRAAFGSTTGPLKTTAVGDWMWDLKAAKKRYNIAICNEITHCSDLSDPRYANICGYCTSSGKAIPAAGGVAAYPYDGNNSCAQSRLILTADKCPPAPPPPPAGSPAAAAYAANAKACAPLSNGSLSRQCLESKAAQVGCTDKGALMDALSAGSDNDYFRVLRQTPSYVKYQQLANPNLNESALQAGKLGVADALSNFRGLYDNATSTANTGIKAAAADLCFTKGLLDSYDFCAELQDNTPPPFALNCLQKAFMRAGGQKSGSMYPTTSNLSMWNSNPNWGAVKTAIANLQAAANSEGFTVNSNSKAQVAAIRNFYGIPLKPLNNLLANINSVESFWFTPDADIHSAAATYSTTFLGRRIRRNIPTLVNSSGITGAIGANASVVYFAQLIPTSTIKFNIKFTGDSGFIFSLNQPMLNVYTGNGVDKPNVELSALYPSFSNPAAEMTTAEPWTISPSGPNIITGYYLGNGTNYRIDYLPSAEPAPSSPPAVKPAPSGLTTLNGYSVTGSPNYPQFKTKNMVTVKYDDKYASFFNNTTSYIGKPISGDRINGTSTIKSISTPYNDGNSSVGNWVKLYDITIADNFTDTTPATGTVLTYNITDPPVKSNANAPQIPFTGFPASMLYLTQDPFAPMISFSLLQNYADYNCDYPFCDKRLGSHKMKWGIYNGNGPTPNYTTDGTNSYLTFASGAGIMSQFRFKMYSFMTATFTVRFTSLPSGGKQAMPFSLWSTYPTIDSHGIYLDSNGQLNLASLNNPNGTTNSTNIYGCVSPPMSTDGPMIQVGVTYLITLRSNRTSETDLNTLVSVSIGAAPVSDLQSNPDALKECTPLVWPNPKNLDNADSGASNYFMVSATDCSFDLFSINMYDYPVKGENLKHAANDDWAQIQTNVYS